MNAVQFTVVGTPEPKGSAKIVPLVRKFPYTIHGFRDLLRAVAITSDNSAVKRWQKAVAEAATRALGNVRLELAGAVQVEAIFYFPIPQSYAKSFNGPHIVRPDGDKCLRAICDSLTGIYFRDDAQVTRLVAEKRYAPHGTLPRVDVTITPIAIGLPLFPEAERRIHGTRDPRVRAADRQPAAGSRVPW